MQFFFFISPFLVFHFHFFLDFVPQLIAFICSFVVLFPPPDLRPDTMGFKNMGFNHFFQLMLPPPPQALPLVGGCLAPFLGSLGLYNRIWVKFLASSFSACRTQDMPVTGGRWVEGVPKLHYLNATKWQKRFHRIVPSESAGMPGSQTRKQPMTECPVPCLHWPE